MTFGEYVKKRRKALRKKQSDFHGYDQTYISKIENGINRPLERESIERLALTLELPKSQVDWLWVFSLLDSDPHEVFQPLKPGNAVNDEKNHYVASGGHGEIHIDLASSEDDVLMRLGPPDNRIRIPAKSKWIYEKFGLHIEFVNGKVVNIVFK